MEEAQRNRLARSAILLIILGAMAVMHESNDAAKRQAALRVEQCAVPLTGKLEACDYVCDETVPWLHFDGSSWADATPPDGTGCHKCECMLASLSACHPHEPRMF